MRKGLLRRLALMLAMCLIVNNCIGELSIRAQAAGTVSQGDLQAEPVDTEEDAAMPDSTAEPENTVAPESTTAPSGKGNVGEATVSLLNEENAVSTLSEDTSSLTLPSDVTEYLSYYNAGVRTFYLADYQDFLDAQNLCADSQVNGFAEVTLILLLPTGTDTEKVWDLTTQADFTGIGTEANPFQGTLYGYFDKSSGQIKVSVPLFANLGEGASVYKLNIVGADASAIIAGNITGTVSLSDMVLSGTVANDSGEAGVIAANVKTGSVLNIAGVYTSGNVTVNGAVAGGIAGTLGAGATVTLGDDVALGTADAKVTVTGTEAAGGHFGTVTGSCTWNLAEESKLVVSVVGGNAYANAGQFAGKLGSTDESTGETAELNIIGGNTVAVDVSGTGNGGGFIGFCGKNTKITKPEGDFTVTGSVNMGWIDTGTGAKGNAGALIGTLENSTMELTEYTITLSGLAGMQVGGIIGEIQGGKYIIRDIETQVGFYGHEVAGGIVGSIISSAAVELQGDIIIGSWLSASNACGVVVGNQDKSLIYYEGIEGKKDDDTAQLTENLDLEEIGRYGGIYRNQYVDEAKTQILIGDGTLENVGVINNTITLSGTDYQLTSVADFETLAIALGTDGAYGMVNASGSAVFSGAAAYGDLLTASYLVTKNVDISYDKTGIVTLNRNDQEGSAYAFKGTMKGSSADVTITQTISGTQERVGVFSTLAGDVTFENLTFAGTISNAEGAGGIAYQSIGTSLTLKNITLSNDRKFENNTELIGGVLAQQSSSTFALSAENITLASTITAAKINKSSGFITNMKNADISMTNVVLGGTFTCTSGSETGGFLGRNWSEIGGMISDVTVLSGTHYDVDGTFGALVTVATSKTGERLTLQDVALNNLKVTAKDSKTNCSLLIRNAQELILEVIDYDSTGCVVENPGEYFDEIAGITREQSGELGETGIISIHNSEVYNTENAFPVYHYENKVDTLAGVTNPYTMYFYDVFQRIEGEDGTLIRIASDSEDSKIGVLDSVDKVLLWCVMHYATAGNVRDTFLGCVDTTDFTIYWDRAMFVGELDLSQISFYPMPITGGRYSGENAVLSFDAAGMDAWTMSNIDKNSQHYGLQAGLFYNPQQELQAKYITLTGKVANLGSESGALVAGATGLTQSGIFKGITLDDLWILDYSKDQSDPGAGLLISNLPGGSFSFEEITMTGYESAGDNKAAAALIGSAGGTDVTNLTLDFSEMVIADDADDRTTTNCKDGGAHNGKVLAYASFLYNYNYTNEASINEGYGLYLFTESDADSGIVTYGQELDYDTEYCDNENKVFSSSQTHPAKLYKPYVYQSKQIEVNPKSGNILKGCGTYEDPYIIETAKQFLTLYRYISETDTTSNQTFYKNWKVIKTGNDSTFCSTKHEAEWDSEIDADGDGVAEGGFTGTGAADARTYGDEDFPTADEMSRAYYRLEDDIDLTADMSSTYEKIAEDFVGFGTQTRPFVGVWYGKGADDTVHTITLPAKTGTEPYETYGFIQYAKGAVIKDINIRTADTVTDSEGNTTEVVPTQIKTAGGGVIACILGGDNIIDGVTVDVEYTATDANAIVGGYVGTVKKGGLILRNVSDTALADFVWNNAAGIANWKMPYGAIAGKVEDGYIVYEGDAGDSYLWSGTGGSSYQQSSNYNVLNIASMKAAAGELTLTKVDNTISFSIPDAADLQLMSMAMNADVLNVRPSDYENYADGGYTENSRSRKADYSDIGCATAVADYVAAAQYDNVMSYSTAADTAYAYPYLYDYMGIGENYADYLVLDSGMGYSVLNPAETIASTDYHIEWNLTGTEYDMSQFGMSFKGVGALYQTGDGYGGTFHGDFDGNNSTITLAMTRYPASNDADTVCRAGLFNTLYHAEAAYKETADYAKPGEAENSKSCFVIKDFTLTGSINQSAKFSEKEICAGGAVAYIQNGNYTFSGVKCTGLTISTISNCGGIIGKIGDDESIYSNIYIADCSVDSTSLKCLYASGGIVANSQAAILKIETSTVDGLTIVCYNTGNSLWHVGGMVGSQDNKSGILIMEGTEESPLSVTNINIDGRQTAGGLVGFANSELAVKHVYCEANTLKAYRHMGGLVGYAASGNNDNAGLIQNAEVKDIVTEEVNLCDAVTSGIGGIIGRNERNLTIANASVNGTVAEDAYQCQIKSLTNKSRTGSHGVGGFVGVHGVGTLTLTDCTADTVHIEADVANNSGYVSNVGAGGLVGFTDKPIVLTGTFTITNLNVKAPLREESDYSVLTAGGCFGYVDSSITGESEANYVGLHVTENTVSAKQAGGLVGYVNTGSNIRLAEILVESGTVTSDESAGGVIGHITTSWSGCALDKTDTDTFNIVQNMEISGRLAGGVIGNMEIAGPLCLESLLLNNNKIVASQTVDSGEYSAGGVIGACYNVGNSDVKIHNVTLQKNTIICEVQENTLSDAEVDKLAVGGLIGGMYQNDITSVGDILCDNPVINSDNKIGVQVAGYEDAEAVGDISTVKLVYYNGSIYQLSNISAPTADGSAMDYEVQQELVQECGCFVGTMVGAVKSDNIQLYVLRSNDTDNKFVTPVIEINPPVTDVGRTTSQLADDYRQYCHIIYGAESTVANVAYVADGSVEETNLSDMKAEVEKVNTTYEGTEGLTGLLQENRLSAETIALFEQAYQEQYASSGTDITIDFPILVYKTEYGTLQDFMEDIADIMTNVAGASATDLDGDYFSITCNPKLCNGTTVADADTDAASITAVTEDGQTTYSSEQYDGISGNYLSYTEVVYTYGWSYNANAHKKTFRLPIFIEEPILYSVHAKIKEGKVTDVNTIKESGISESVGEIIMANDSDYTLLLEYAYSRARENMPDGTVIDKVFSLEAVISTETKTIPVGTRLMLIDVNANKPYYYTVESEGISSITFTDFKDSSGAAYVNKSINTIETAVDEGEEYYTDLGGHQLTGVGVETFLLTVLAVDGDKDNTAYEIHAGIEIPDENLESRFYAMNEHQEEVAISIMAIPGLEISFYEKGTETDMDGEVSKESSITVKGCIEIKADGAYWVLKGEAANSSPWVDSANSGKYLELAFYLRDTSKNRVRFPSGTNFSYKVGTDGTYSEKKVIPNDSVVYYYKDIRDAFAQSGSKYFIEDIDQDTRVPVEFVLDFSGADMSNITEEKYIASLDLLRTPNMDYPMGNGNKLDEYSEEVDANAVQQLGFAVRATDLTKLAINTYPAADEQNIINYSVMFDFGELLKQSSGAGKEALLEKWSGYDYTVTYQVYKKIQSGDSVLYEAYDGNDIVLTATGGVEETTSQNGTMETLYQFTTGEMEADEGFISFPATVTINTAELTEDLTNLTNYKIEARLVITERETDTQAAKETTDFFIYTITRLKTDL